MHHRRNQGLFARLFGWTFDPKPTNKIKKAVVVVGPHTSNWDFIVGKIAKSDIDEHQIIYSNLLENA
jgi:hypothetical protein